MDIYDVPLFGQPSPVSGAVGGNPLDPLLTLRHSDVLESMLERQGATFPTGSPFPEVLSPSTRVMSPNTEGTVAQPRAEGIVMNGGQLTQTMQAGMDSILECEVCHKKDFSLYGYTN